MKKTLLAVTIIVLLVSGCGAETRRLEAQTGLVEAQENLVQTDDTGELVEMMSQIVTLLIQESGNERAITRKTLDELFALVGQQQSPDRSWLWILAAATMLGVVYLLRKKETVVVIAPGQAQLGQPSPPLIDARAQEVPFWPGLSADIPARQDVIIE